MMWVTTAASSHDVFARGLTTVLVQPLDKSQRLIVALVTNEDGFVEGCLDVFPGNKTGGYHKEMDSIR